MTIRKASDSIFIFQLGQLKIQKKKKFPSLGIILL
jgi:hypothetical protein